MIPPGSKSKVARSEVDLSDSEPLIDTTQILPKHSKRTSRLQKKSQKKTQTKRAHSATYTDLPAEILLHILSFLQPSSIFRLSRTSHALHSFISENESHIARQVIAFRYSSLTRAFPLPVAMEDVDPSLHPALRNPLRQAEMQKKALLHIPNLDFERFCTCMTCVLAWNHLGFILDFARWLPRLQSRDGPRVPLIGRKEGNPDWNLKLMDTHRDIMTRALTSPLLYARILETHLHSTIARIQYWSFTTRSPKFSMTAHDILSQTDHFLENEGRGNFEGVPFNRDRYYNLEVYVPNRSWKKDEGRWRYWPRDQHLTDLGIVRRFEGSYYGPRLERWREEERVREERKREEEKVRVEGSQSGRAEGVDELG